MLPRVSPVSETSHRQIIWILWTLSTGRGEMTADGNDLANQAVVAFSVVDQSERSQLIMVSNIPFKQHHSPCRRSWTNIDLDSWSFLWMFLPVKLFFTPSSPLAKGQRNENKWVQITGGLIWITLSLVCIKLKSCVFFTCWLLMHACMCEANLQWTEWTLDPKWIQTVSLSCIQETPCTNVHPVEWSESNRSWQTSMVRLFSRFISAVCSH